MCAYIVSLVTTLLLAVPNCLYSLESSAFESRLSMQLNESISLPAVLIQLIAQYAIPTPSKAVLIVDSEDVAYQRSGTTFRMFVIGKNPQRPALPLCLRFEVPWSILVHKQETIPCPESWYPEQLTRTFTELYREVMYDQNIPLFTTRDPIPIEDKSNSAACIQAPYITEETLDIFYYLSRSQITFVDSDSLDAQTLRNLTLVHLAPGLTSRSLAQLQKNIDTYCTQICSIFSGKRFPVSRVIEGRSEIIHTARLLNNMMNNYLKQKDSIAKIIAQKPMGSLEPVFLKGSLLSTCVEYASKRKEERYKVSWLFQ